MRTQLVALLLAAAGTIGCTHTMEVKNLSQYSLQATAPRSLTFSVQTAQGDDTARSLTEALREGLASQSSVSRVTMVSETPPDFTPDYVVAMRATTAFDGSGWNYLVSFPGFLIFTHAWNGYVYSAHTTTQLDLSRPGSPETIASRTVEADWDFRHCDFGRG